MNRFTNYIILFFSFLICTNSFSQNASDYFPAATGYNWYYKVTPFDSLNNPVDSLSLARVDSFSAEGTYKNKPAKIVLTKTAPRDIVLNLPFIDSSYVNLEGTNIFNYIGDIPFIDTFTIAGISAWYNVYQLASGTSTTYTLLSKDTTININGSTYNLRFKVTGRRLADENITTAIGSFTCKKFLLKPAIQVIIFSIPITIIELSDTVYVAPVHYVVREVRPTVSADLTLLGLPSITLYGLKTEILAAPGVLSVSPLTFNLGRQSGDTTVAVNNSGPGDLNWNAEVISGNDWITLTDTAGTNSGDLRFSYSANPTLEERSASIRIWDDFSFSGEQIVEITQERGVTYSGKENIIKEYNLSQNYPNPFNPSTKINFSLPTSGIVTLKVYNILGNEVADVFKGWKDSGVYDFTFNASSLSSGVYFYKLTVNNFTSIKKMTLLK